MNIPEVRIIYSRLLHEKVSQVYWKQFWEKEGKQLPTKEASLARVESYKDAWSPVQEKILKGMTELFELEFYKPIIDVHVAPLVPAMSTPLITHMRCEPDEYIDLLTHELIHVLLSDGRPSYNHTQWKEDNFPDLDQLTANHILVHAGLKYIYLDVLNESYRLARDIENTKDAQGYRDAWNIVQSGNYKDIINSAKKYYGPK